MSKKKILVLEEGSGFHKVALGKIDRFEATAAIISASFRLNIQGVPGMPEFEIMGNDKFRQHLEELIKKRELEDFTSWSSFAGPLSDTLIMRIKWSGKIGSGKIGVSYKREGYITLVKGFSGLIEVERARQIIAEANRILSGE